MPNGIELVRFTVVELCPRDYGEIVDRRKTMHWIEARSESIFSEIRGCYPLNVNSEKRSGRSAITRLLYCFEGIEMEAITGTAVRVVFVYRYRPGHLEFDTREIFS